METKVDSILNHLNLLTENISVNSEDDIWIKYFLPFLLLLFSFGAKAIIDRKADKKDAIKSILEIPIELTFLSTSLLIAFAAYDHLNTSRNFFIVILFIFLGCLNIFLWRRSLDAYELNDLKTSRKIGIWNGVISFLVLLATIILI